MFLSRSKNQRGVFKPRLHQIKAHPQHEYKPGLNMLQLEDSKSHPMISRNSNRGKGNSFSNLFDEKMVQFEPEMQNIRVCQHRHTYKNNLFSKPKRPIVLTKTKSV